jgi:hypothetical protein
MVRLVNPISVNEALHSTALASRSPDLVAKLRGTTVAQCITPRSPRRRPDAMSSRPLIAATFALPVLFAAGDALAQNCPPGSWFCADARAGASVTVGGGVVAPPVVAPPVVAPPVIVAPPVLAPPVIVAPPAPVYPQYPQQPVYPQYPQQPVYPQYPQQPYQQPGTTRVVIVPGNRQTNYYQPAPQQPPQPGLYVRTNNVRPRFQREWGLNLHLQGVGLGGKGAMSGAGAGLRYRFDRSFAVEGNVDVFAGTDYNGLSRTESAVSFNAMWFLNPASTFQYYLIGGLGWSAASAEGQHPYWDRGTTSNPYGTTSSYSYGYFGGHAGFGAEWRLGRSLAVNGDFRLFVRDRIDGNTYQAEFVDGSSGRTTNKSGGGLFTLGATLYF